MSYSSFVLRSQPHIYYPFDDQGPILAFHGLFFPNRKIETAEIFLKTDGGTV